MFSHEFAESKVLQWALGALAFNYLMIFDFWIKLPEISRSSVDYFIHSCPPYFQNCDSLYIFEALPEGYSQTFFYMLFFGALLWVVYLFSEKRWREAQLVLIPFFLWHFVNVFFLTDTFSANYEYYVVGFGLILLFFPHKEFFVKLLIVMFYFLSTVSKIHPAWIEGGYFNNLSTGLPLFPDWSIPLWTNLIILAEMVGAWFLLSGNRFYQRAALVFYVTFHLYSGILVEYRYPSTVLPMLLIMFGPWYRYQKVPLDRKSIIGWLFIALLIVLQFTPRLFIPGDEKLTLEGNKYGLYMFESNHQCISETVFHLMDGSTSTKTRINTSARIRCNPYTYWFPLKEMCERDAMVESISWTLDHSINGDPFLRIVDVEDVCVLKYTPLKHNEWIKTEKDNPEIIGWPVKNLFH